MLAWIRSPRGSTATATVAAVALAMFWLEPWSKPLPFDLLHPRFGQETAPSTIEAAALPAAATQPVSNPAPASPSGQPSALPPPGSGDAVLAVRPVPSFDVVRVEPDGAAVIAGRGAPNSRVALLDGDREIADAPVNANGEFTLLPPALGEGSHNLSLRSKDGSGAPASSSQSVAVAVTRDGHEKPLVALMTPDQPTRVLSGAVGGGVPAPSVATGSQPALPVAIQSVEAAGGGTFMTSGVAKPGNQCRLYLNGAYLADVTAGADGRWSVEVKHGMRPGRYTVRADEMAPGSNAVLHRAEVPFDYPVMAGLGPHQGRVELMARAGSIPSSNDARSATFTGSATEGATGSLPANAAVIATLQSATVMRGDSLWRISRKMLGHGVQYTEIYASNAQQIRDPALIYPGQIFVVPKPGRQ